MSRSGKRAAAAASALFAAALLSAPYAKAAPLRAAKVDGVWDASVQIKDGAIPFKLDLSGAPDQVRATYFDGERAVTTATRLASTARWTWSRCCRPTRSTM